MRESSLQKQIIQYLRSQGDYVFKAVGSSMQQRGTADLLVCHQGLFIALEVKAPDGKESMLQQVERRKVMQAGGIAEVIYELDEVYPVLKLAERIKWS